MTEGSASATVGSCACGAGSSAATVGSSIAAEAIHGSGAAGTSSMAAGGSSAGGTGSTVATCFSISVLVFPQAQEPWESREWPSFPDWRLHRARMDAMSCAVDFASGHASNLRQKIRHLMPDGAVGYVVGDHNKRDNGNQHLGRNEGKEIALHAPAHGARRPRCRLLHPWLRTQDVPQSVGSLQARRHGQRTVRSWGG